MVEQHLERNGGGVIASCSRSLFSFSRGRSGDALGEIECLLPLLWGDLALGEMH